MLSSCDVSLKEAAVKYPCPEVVNLSFQNSGACYLEIIDSKRKPHLYKKSDVVDAILRFLSENGVSEIDKV